MESTGAAKAEAQSRAEAARIQGEAAVNEAKLKAEAMRIEAVRFYFLFLLRASTNPSEECRRLMSFKSSEKSWFCGSCFD